MELNVETEIEAPKGKVWAAITDFENCAQMIPAIVALKVLHRPEEGLVGLKWTETRMMFGKESSETMCIIECQDEEFYRTRAENQGAIYLSKMAVAEHNGRTVLSMSFAVTSDSLIVRMFSSLISVFMKKSMIKILKKDLSDIKKFVEAQA